MVQVALVSGDPHLIDQPLPVADEEFEDLLLRRTAQVVADGEHPPRAIGRVPNMPQDTIERGVAEVDQELLGEHAVDAVLPHPAEVPLHRLAVRRGEQRGSLPLLVGERRGRISRPCGELGHVGPHLEDRRRRVELRRVTAAGSPGQRNQPW